MSEHGGAAAEPSRTPRSRLADYADLTEPAHGPAAPVEKPPPATGAESASAATEPGVAEDPGVTARRREFAELLGEFRRTPVLVPLGGDPGGLDGDRAMLTADLNGIRFILAFSDEQALARYAQARGEGSRSAVYISRPDGSAHVFNAVNTPHGVVFLDGQSGTLGRLEQNVSGIGHIPYRNGAP